MLNKWNFDCKTHTYLTDGRVIPSVTRALDFSGLVDFQHVRRDILEHKTELGQAVHRACQLYDLGTLDAATVDERINPYLRSWIGFRNATGFLPRKIEEQHVGIINGMYCGMRLDREGVFHGQQAVLDLKIGEHQDYHGVQLAGYAALLPMAEVESPFARFIKRARYGVQLLASGEPARMRKYEDPHDYHIFAAALLITTTKLHWGQKLKDIENEEA